MGWRSVLFGRRLANEEDTGRRVGATLGVPAFGLDALGSAAYGPEAALTILLPLGAAGLAYILPVTGCIVALLVVVFLSYRQTIAAYPSGGGSYIVARRNLGARAGLLAAAALMVDYMLNAAVGISTGVGALVSALPQLQPYTLPLCLVILALLTVANLRGLREAGFLWVVPTWCFVVGLLGIIVAGLVKTVLAGGHPVPLAAPAELPPVVAGGSVWLLMRAFASGCTAMTGVEAVSNGVPAFREPVVATARRTLTIIMAILGILLLGLAFVARAYGIGATEPGAAGYQSILSQIIGAVAGRGVIYYVLIVAILCVLSLSANTSFAGFPRLCHIIAHDGYLPYAFAHRGRRLVFTLGICCLSACAAGLLVAFKGVTDRLIPLFAIGALLSFTLSQAGMVMHWKKVHARAHRGAMVLNALGCLGTAITAGIVIVAKFHEGAWITLVVIPGLIGLMVAVRRHYHHAATEVLSRTPLAPGTAAQPIAVVPVEEWDRVTQEALRFAMSIASEVKAVHVDCGDSSLDLRANWEEWVAAPAREAGRPVPELVTLRSPYRRVFSPIISYILTLELREKDRQIAVVISGLVTRRWYQRILHNQRGAALVDALMYRGDRRIVVVNVPWYSRA